MNLTSENLVHKAVGWGLRTIDLKELIRFLDKHSKQMPRVMLRYSIEKLSKSEKDKYMKKS
ncbi:MAG: DNA alkylation repair protein [Candidatus Dojkabacteria bacterium]